MTRFTPTIALSVLLATASPLAVHADTAPGTGGPAAERMFDATTLSIPAFGQVKVAPDQASITLGVQSKAATASDALRQNASDMNRVMSSLRRAGLPDKAIQTSNLTLEPQYTYAQNLPPVLNGYQVSDDVVITVDDLSKLGQVLDAVVTAGANQVNGISFGLKDPGAAEDAARLAAVKSLRAKSDLYVQATGYRAARLVSLSEGGGYAPEPVRPMMAMAKSVGASMTPVSPGELTVRVDVSGLYELTR